MRRTLPIRIRKLFLIFYWKLILTGRFRRAELPSSSNDTPAATRIQKARTTITLLAPTRPGPKETKEFTESSRQSKDFRQKSRRRRRLSQRKYPNQFLKSLLLMNQWQMSTQMITSTLRRKTVNAPPAQLCEEFVAIYCVWKRRMHHPVVIFFSWVFIAQFLGGWICLGSLVLLSSFIEYHVPPSSS